MAINQIEFMINCGKKTKELIIEEFIETKSLIISNKKECAQAPTLCTTHFIRMLIAKMKILNGYLKTDVDYMQKEYKVFKKHASIVMEEYEEYNENYITEVVDDIYNNESGYLKICDYIKYEYDLLEDYIQTAKKMNLNGLHF